MKIKFDKSSEKVKTVAFHKTRFNWVGVGLFSGEVQIWDFRNGLVVAEFKANDSCIRSIDFHPMQSLIISGGDDFVIRGYDYAENKIAFELKGHADYLRTVQFHHELPWLVSCSDDQTLRIWNWQSKQQISVITGHGHYIMCAKFHPNKDLIVSGSLDSTLRIWDFSKLKSKFSSSHGTVYMLSNDVEAFIITEAHMKGVNWVDFHPTENIVATCSDDKLIKFFTFTNSNAYESQVIHGHTHNVSCVQFSQDGKYLFSNGEDFQLRIWDKKGNLINKIETPEERQWSIGIHPSLPLVSIGCDKSFKIIGTHSEKIHYQKQGKFVIYYSNLDGCIKLSDLVNNTTKSFNFGYQSNLEKQVENISLLQLNTFVTSGKIQGFYKLKKKNQMMLFSIRIKDLFCYGQEIQGENMTFINSHQYVVFKNQQLHLYELNNFQFLQIVPIKLKVDNIYQGLFNQILIKSESTLSMFDMANGQQTFTISKDEIKELKQIYWNNERTYAILKTSKGLILINKYGKVLVMKNSEVKIKSVLWLKNDHFIYNNHEHVNFMLINGEEGIIRSIDKIFYLVKEDQEKLVYININEEYEEIDIDKSEMEIKLAIMHSNFNEVKKLLKEKSYFGKSVVSYILKKKHNFLSLQLAQDKQTAFYLALHADKLQEAFDLAREINEQEKFKILADAAIKTGAFSLAELCLKYSHQKEKLLTFYTLTGNKESLRKLEFDNINQKFNQTLFTGNIKERIKILAETGQVYLAYASAKLHGVEEYVEALENAIPGIDQQIEWPKESYLMVPPKPLVEDVNESHKILINWPLMDVEIQENDDIDTVSIDQVILEEEVEENEQMYNKAQQGGLKYSKTTHNPTQVIQKQEIKVDEQIENAWGADQDLDLDLSEVSQDENEKKEWIIKNSVAAWEHFVIGDITGGINLLQTQIGLRRVENLNPYIQELSKNQDGIYGEELPNCYSIEYFQNVYNEMLVYANQAKLQEALELIKDNINQLMIMKSHTEEDQEFAMNLLNKFLNYYISFKAKLENDNVKDFMRKTELSLIMSMSTLEPAHALLILQLAVNNLYKLGCFVYASFVAKKYLKISQENESSSKQDSVKKMQKILKACQQKGSNKYDLNVMEADINNEEWYKIIDFGNLKIENPMNMVFCSFDKSHYLSDKKGQECEFCNSCEIGYMGIGLKLTNQ